MTCTVCGKAHPCAHSLQTPAVLLDSQVPAEAAEARTSVEEARSRADQQYWREEVISRVRQHRARRRRRSDGDLSLELDFPAEPAALSETEAPARFEETAPVKEHPLRHAKPMAPPKSIRFPRTLPVESRPAVEDLELAEPVRDIPRILDTPEEMLEVASRPKVVEPPAATQMELIPSFADIR